MVRGATPITMTVIAWAIVVAIAGFGGRADGADLNQRIETILQAPGFGSAHWGLLVVDQTTGDVVFERNADQLFAPSSVAMLFSGAAAIEALGVDHRFQTSVCRRGTLAPDGTLDGDLILVAVGDPSLGGRTSPEDGTLLYRDIDHTHANSVAGAELVEADPLAGLDHLAREVKATGISAVTGEVIIDNRLFDPAPTTGDGPTRVEPIMVNDNLIDVVITPAAEPGKPALVRTVPPSAFYAHEARVQTVAEGSATAIEVRREGRRRFSVRGKVSVGHPPVIRCIEVEDPASFARALFIEQLRARGVRVEASPLGENPADRLPEPAEVAGAPKVGQYISPPFREYLRVVLKTSHNLHASALPLLIAVSHGDRTLADGLRHQGAFLRSLGMPPGGVSLGSGAGGSRADLLSPRATVALLLAIARRPEAKVFESALPILGRDGTAADHVSSDSPVHGHARVQTGTEWIDDPSTGRPVLISKALAGYMETASGRSLVFAFYLNHVSTSDAPPEQTVTSLAASRLLGALCETLYVHDRPAPSSSSSTPGGPPPARPPSPEPTARLDPSRSGPS